MIDVDLASADVLDETRAFNTELETQIARLPPTESVPPELTRAARRAGKGIFPPPVYLDAAEDREVPGRDGPVRVRVVRPPGPPTGLYLHLHGGGWVLGAADLQDVALDRFARRTGVVAVSVDYRLAPEHPFPAGPDDCEDAARWVVDHGLAEFGVEEFVIGGESAGGHLSLLTALKLRDAGLGGALAGLDLVYGAFDLTMTPSQRAWDRNLVLSPALLRWFTELATPGLTIDERKDWRISPLYADPGGLPPALLTVGTLDPLVDDTLFLAARLRHAGVEAQVRTYPEGVHAFNSWDLAISRAHHEDRHAFVRRVLDVPASYAIGAADDAAPAAAGGIASA